MHSHNEKQDTTDKHSSNNCSSSTPCFNNAKVTNEHITATQIGGKRFNWIIRGMDCPSCAQKIEAAVKQIPAVTQANVFFSTEKLVVDANIDVRDAVEKVVKIAGYQLFDADKGVANVTFPPQSLLKEAKSIIILAILIAISWSIELVNPTLGSYAFILSTLFGLYPIARKSLRLIRTGSPFTIETLMTIATLGAIFIHATEEAAMVILLFMLGEILESYSATRARCGVSALMALVPENALLIQEGKKVVVPIAQLRPNDIIEVAPGGRLPVDAELITVFASFDESALTGESIPVERHAGEKLAAGCLSVDRVVQIKVVSEQGQNTIDRILLLIEQAEERRAPIERFIDHFSRVYTPLIMLLAALVMIIPPLFFGGLWNSWIYRGLTLLLIGCPCALVISTPAAITSALAAATRRGALIKGGAALEQLGRITTVALDKTGTLTEGKPQVTDAIPAKGVTLEYLAKVASSVEVGSHHPLAKAIINYAETLKQNIVEADYRKALAGKGIEGYLAAKHILVTAPARLDPPLNHHWQEQIEILQSHGKTVVVTLEDGKVIGLLAMQDILRSDAIKAIGLLKSMKINAVMLTGDNTRAAAAIASQLNIDFYAELLPEDKVALLTELNKNASTMMVGDGINDAPAMKASSIGVAMGSGSDVALETADAALTHNRLTGLAEIIALSRATGKIIRQNIVLSIGLKSLFLVASLFGVTSLWIAVLADTGATALVTANAIRLLTVKLRDID